MFNYLLFTLVLIQKSLACFTWCTNPAAGIVPEVISLGNVPTSYRIVMPETDQIYSFLGYKGVTSKDQADAYNMDDFTVPPGTVYQGAEYGKGIYMSDSLKIAQFYSKAGHRNYTNNSFVCLIYALETNPFKFVLVKSTLHLGEKLALNKKYDVIIARLRQLGWQLVVTQRNPSNNENLKAFCRHAQDIEELPGEFSYKNKTNFAWASRVGRA